jgi:hypothetical protein
VEQHRDAIPGRVRVVARVLRCQSIKCPYTGAGAWMTCVQVPSSEAVLAERVLSHRARRSSPEGALSPRARRTSPEGALRPRARRAPLVGASIPRAGRTSPEGASAVPPWWAAGATWVVSVSCALGSWVSPCFAFFACFKRVSPGYLRDPYGCPRHRSSAPPPYTPRYST